jgi:hypothetical protein
LFSGAKQKKVRRDRALAARFMPGGAGEPATVKNPRPRAMTRPLALVFASSFGFSTSFYLMLSVVPLYATSVGAGQAGARGSLPARSCSRRFWPSIGTSSRKAS